MSDHGPSQPEEGAIRRKLVGLGGRSKRAHHRRQPHRLPAGWTGPRRGPRASAVRQLRAGLLFPFPPAPPIPFPLKFISGGQGGESLRATFDFEKHSWDSLVLSALDH
jgi:hypothetical protein